MSQKLAVVVTGGTGKQGGAVVKSLLERGHEVRPSRAVPTPRRRGSSQTRASRSSARHSKTRHDFCSLTRKSPCEVFGTHRGAKSQATAPPRP
jgi:nucleoside-diphosphate-sugar epimerase